MFIRSISIIRQPGIISKPARIMVLVMMVSSLVSGCKSSQNLTYDTPLLPVSLETESLPVSAPNIIVIASSDEIAPPAEGVSYPKSVMDVLTSLDYSKSFAILFLVGQVNGDIKVVSIVKEGHNVTIDLDKYSIGPGNYVVPGYTMAYLLVVIEKSGTWGEDIHFIVKANQTDLIAESDHYIP